jgi:hypothetical protein
MAADKLPAGKDQPTLAALGFLSLGPRFNDNKNDIINDRIDVVCKGLLGLTVTCARCHDHKFDPIPTRIIIPCAAYLTVASSRLRSLPCHAVKSTPQYIAFAQKLNALNQTLVQTEDEMKGPMAGDKKKELRKDANQLRREIAQLQSNDPGSPPCATVLYDTTKPHDSPIFIRGVAENKGDIAPRRFLEILSGPYRAPFSSGSGRMELAQAIVNPANPLTSRVLVNRDLAASLWAGHRHHSR